MPITTINHRQLLRAEPRPIIGPGPRSAPPIIPPAEPGAVERAPGYKPQYRRPPVTPAEFERIAAAASPHLAKMIRALWHSALAVVELRNLTRACVTTRELSPALRRIIADPPCEHAEFVFYVPGRRGGQLSVDRIVNAITAACRAAGVEATSLDIRNGAARCAGSRNAVA
jgi:integrase